MLWVSVSVARRQKGPHRRLAGTEPAVELLAEAGHHQQRIVDPDPEPDHRDHVQHEHRHRHHLGDHADDRQGDRDGHDAYEQRDQRRNQCPECQDQDHQRDRDQLDLVALGILGAHCPDVEIQSRPSRDLYRVIVAVREAAEGALECLAERDHDIVGIGGRYRQRHQEEGGPAIRCHET